MRSNVWMAVVVIGCTLVLLCRVFYYYRKKRQLITTKYRVRVYSEKEDDCIALISYQDETGNKQVWLYEKEWEITVQLPGNRRPVLMASAQYLEKEKNGEENESAERPLVSGEIVFKDKLFKEEKSQVVFLEIPA